MTYSQIRICRKCGQENRVPAKHLASRGRCGKCKTELPALSEPIELSENDFEDTIKELHVPTLVQFYVPVSYGVPGQMGIGELSRKFSSVAIFARVDVIKNHRLMERIGVKESPLFRLYKHGEVFFEAGGGITGRKITQMIDSSMTLH